MNRFIKVTPYPLEGIHGPTERFRPDQGRSSAAGLGPDRVSTGSDQDQHNLEIQDRIRTKKNLKLEPDWMKTEENLKILNQTGTNIILKISDMAVRGP